MRFAGNTPDICIGGKGINVAKVCVSLGEPVALYCFVGGLTGEMVRAYMKPRCSVFRSVSVCGATRETINIIDRKNERETEIVEKGPTVSESEWSEMEVLLREDICQGDIVICSGITLPGCPNGVYTLISEIAHSKGALCFLDTNGRDLTESMSGKFDFWKPNIHEIMEVTGCPSDFDEEQLISFMTSVDDKAMPETLVSLGNEGGLLFTHGRVLRAYVPDIPVVSTIGCGDSTVAGYAIAVSRGESPEQAFRSAMACGTLNATKKGIASELTAAEVSEIMNQIKIEEIKGVKK